MTPARKRAFVLAWARRLGLDPRAVDAIARVEGGYSGAVGDSGTSFGPFQLHVGGALPSGIGNPQHWANSRAGLLYALHAIDRVASGLRGRSAVASIARNFERPADVQGEISKALGYYGSGGGIPSGGGGGGRGGHSSANLSPLLSLLGAQAPVLRPVTGFTPPDPRAAIASLSGSFPESQTATSPPSLPSRYTDAELTDRLAALRRELLA